MYSYLRRIALAIGMRSGELLALRWSDVDLLTRAVRVQRTYVHGIGVTTPKSGQARTVDLTPQAATLFESLFAAGGAEGLAEGLVFQRDGRTHRPELRPQPHPLPGAGAGGDRARVGARRQARLPQPPPQLRPHHARGRDADHVGAAGARALEHRTHCGHHGRWGRAAQQAQAEKLEGAFPL